MKLVPKLEPRRPVFNPLPTQPQFARRPVDWKPLTQPQLLIVSAVAPKPLKQLVPQPVPRSCDWRVSPPRPPKPPKQPQVLPNSSVLVVRLLKQPQFEKVMPSQQPEIRTFTQPRPVETQVPVELVADAPWVAVTIIVLEVTVVAVHVRLTATALLTLPTAGVMVIEVPPDALVVQPVQLALKLAVAPLLLAETVTGPVLSARKEKV
jgi:hypothetical protein